MTVASEKALRDLEFHRLRRLLAEHASSSLGEEAIGALTPVADRETIERAAAEVGEAISFLTRHGGFSLGAVRDMTPLIDRAHEHASLEGEALVTILLTLEATHAIRDRLVALDDLERLAAHGERLTEARDLEKRIRRAVDDNGEIRDDASPLLAKLTARRRTLERRIEEKLRALIDRNQELISESVVTRRGGRLVVPIKSGAVGVMGFVVHDRSATGQTLYAEPTSLVGENNAIAELVGAIRDERLRVLRELTRRFLAIEHGLRRNRMILGHLDGLFARASYAVAHRCHFPTLSHRLVLQDARHPLLPPDRVVPVSLALGGRQRMTVITGPNTGGKTVTLKTVGLLTLMVQAGIPIPASPDSELPIVSRVRTDIGDEQSIAQNLSTFSAHMRNIVSLLEEADETSLILLDELGAGTDPQEGAALGLAVLERLLEAEALVAVSTHLTPLKYFAIRHPAVKTASMAFDTETLAPTFRVIEGIPGRSNAFVIARKLGLAKDLVERARSYLSHGEIRAEDIIEELQREREAMQRLKAQAERERVEAKRVGEDLARQVARFERDRESSLSDRLKAFERFLRDGQARIEQRLAEANEAAEVDDVRAAYRDVAELREELRQHRDAAREPVGHPTLEALDLEVGLWVHVYSVDADGRILQLDGRGRVAVDVDGIRIATTASDLGPAGEPPGEAARKRPVVRPRYAPVSMQLNVRGMTVSEALREVEGYLDRLLLADVRSASILHGKGTGALREAVGHYLASCSFVNSFGVAPPGEGGDGVTVFELSGDADGPLKG